MSIHIELFNVIKRSNGNIIFFDCLQLKKIEIYWSFGMPLDQSINNVFLGRGCLTITVHEKSCDEGRPNLAESPLYILQVKT